MNDKSDFFSYIPDVENKVLNLTRNEALYLDDNLSLLVEKDIDDAHIQTLRPLSHSAGVSTTIELIEKLGHAILFTTDDKNKGLEAEVILSDADLFILRELAHSYVKIGTERVGFNLKRKIYSLLYKQSYKRNEITNTLLAQIDSEPKALDAEGL